MTENDKNRFLKPVLFIGVVFLILAIVNRIIANPEKTIFNLVDLPISVFCFLLGYSLSKILRS